MKPTRQQDEALRACQAWIRGPDQVFYLGGYAGTGKTTLAQHLVKDNGIWLFAAYTGKAAHVLRQKGCENASTIHGLIYRPAGQTKASEIATLEERIAQVSKRLEASPDDTKLQQHLLRLKIQLRELSDENQPKFSLWANSPLAEYDVTGVVIDEVSMVDKKIAEDLESFGKKVLVLGDPAQLPPVGAGGYYTKRKPDYLLTEVHRQAKESGILRLATMVRNKQKISNFKGEGVRFMDVGAYQEELRTIDEDANAPGLSSAFQILCGKNVTRRGLNQRMREGRNPNVPTTGEPVICLRNDREINIYNGSQWVVEKAVKSGDNIVDLKLTGDVGNVELVSWLHHFDGSADELKDMFYSERSTFQEFDYGYALTVHKAQGSQWDHVVLYNEHFVFRNDARRWLYTGITRASKELTLVTMW